VEAMKRIQQSGFTLIEMLVTLVIFLIVSGIVMSGMIQMMRTQGTVANRTEMHSSVRSATELLQQEIGQAGRISLPTGVIPVTLTGPIVGGPVAQTVAISSIANMFQNMLLDVDAGQNFEVVTVATVTPGFITAIFSKNHPGDATGKIQVQVSGSFGTGIVPPSFTNGALTGSTGTQLKLYGDINGDGKIVYVDYVCNQGTPAVPGFLYRNETDNAVVLGTMPIGVNPSMYLLNNVVQNPNNAPCFTYQVQTVGGVDFVTDVAVTLTVQTQLKDPQTNQFQNETKALLNITPRNVYYVWEATSLGEVPRNQPMPANIGNML
jgi:prepilin-type N-terminal cleavage/methylation domain-containing protein